MSITLPQNVVSLDDNPFALQKVAVHLGCGWESTLYFFERCAFQHLTGRYCFISRKYGLRIQDTQWCLKIGRQAFAECELLHSIKTPGVVSAIGDYAFSTTKRLQ